MMKISTGAGPTVPSFFKANEENRCFETVLFDIQGKFLAEFSTRDDFGLPFFASLTTHNIRLCSGK